MNIEPENTTPGKGRSSSKPSFSGSMLNFGGVTSFSWWFQHGFNPFEKYDIVKLGSFFQGVGVKIKHA